MKRSIDLIFFKALLLLCIALPDISLRLGLAHRLGNETDQVSLLEFKNFLTRDSQRVLSSWNDSHHFCEWEGITCDHRPRRVTALNLTSHGLVGSISPYIGNLSFLKLLHLPNNSLHGQIPDEIGRLFRLQDLFMDDNSLSGPLPVNLSQCLNLVNFSISSNKLTGKIPEEFGSLRKLARFQIYRNYLTGAVPTSLGNLTSLEFISLTENSFTGSIPDSLAKLERIWFLSISLNNLSGLVPPSLYNISSLQIISLALNQLEGSLPHDIGTTLPFLKTLYIGGNYFSGSIPISLFTNASYFTYLSLTRNRFSGKIPIEVGSRKNLVFFSVPVNYLGSGGEVDDLAFLTSLSNCTDLETLHVEQNNLGGMLPSSISNLSTQLTSLSLYENQIYGSIPSDIWKLVSLIDISLQSNHLSGKIPWGIGMFPNLQILRLNGNRFSGRIPYSFGNLSSIYTIDLSNNVLEGGVVTSLGKCQLLQKLYFDHNQLTGTLPQEVIGLSTQLTDLTLSHNHFNGSVPLEVGNLLNLRRFDVSENKLSGVIPSTLGNCLILEEFYLQGNVFRGPLPSSFGSLKGLRVIDLSRNNLSGELFPILKKLPYIQKLNISLNDFEGEVPIGGIFANDSAVSVVGNHKLCGGIRELHLSKCNMNRPKKNHFVLKLTLGILLPLALIVMSLLLVVYAKAKSSSKFISTELENNLQRVSYNELHGATDGFSSRNLIGSGSYASVYKGVFHQEVNIKAVKILNLMERNALKSFVAECQVLKEIRHRNLLKILTVCSSVDNQGNDFKALILEFMPNGSVENWLYPTSDEQDSPRMLDFCQRLNIAIDIASALDYLHNQCGTPIVHCDLKPSNVLLDDDMVARVADFGLAKFLYKSNSNSDTTETNSISVRGTIGYIPPECGLRAEVSTQGDMYSYGILLLEMFTGRKPTDPMFDQGMSLHNFCEANLTGRLMDTLDMRLLDSFSIYGVDKHGRGINTMLGCLFSILEIGLACSSEYINDRMRVGDAHTKLQTIKETFSSSGIE